VVFPRGRHDTAHENKTAGSICAIVLINQCSGKQTITYFQSSLIPLSPKALE
jgi:hypothetical protein